MIRSFRAKRISPAVFCLRLRSLPVPSLLADMLDSVLRTYQVCLIRNSEWLSDRSTYVVVIARRLWEVTGAQGFPWSTAPTDLIVTGKGLLVLISRKDHIVLKLHSLAGETSLRNNYRTLQAAQSNIFPTPVNMGTASDTVYSIESSLPGRSLDVDTVQIDSTFAGIVGTLASFYSKHSEKQDADGGLEGLLSTYISLVPDRYLELFLSCFEDLITNLEATAEVYDHLTKTMIHGDLTCRNTSRSGDAYYFCDLDRSEYSLAEFDALSFFFDYLLRSRPNPSYREYATLIFDDMQGGRTYADILDRLYNALPSLRGNRAHAAFIVRLFVLRAAAFILNDAGMNSEIDVSFMRELKVS